MLELLRECHIVMRMPGGIDDNLALAAPSLVDCMEITGPDMDSGRERDLKSINKQLVLALPSLASQSESER